MSRDVHAPIKDEKFDFLGRKDLAERIYSRLSDANCPQAIGIYGGWGTGKTSLLNLINLKNEEKRKSGKGLFIKFIDAWSYELVGSLLEPIIFALRELALNEKMSDDTVKTYLKRMRKFILLGASDLVLRRLGLSLEDAKKLIAEVNDESGVGKIYLDWENLVDDAESTKLAFAELVKVALSGVAKNGYFSDQIVFFIDNLDRCAPDTAIQLLESIRNYLTVPGCTWVLAVDSDVIASYVSKKYEDTDVDGYSYLDKIVPEQYHLSLSPTLDREGILRLLNALNELDEDRRLWIEERKIPQIPKVLVPRRLIKSASKIREYYNLPLDNRPSPEVIINLTFLYHTWPAFYQRLSSASKEHIRGILDNFFPKKQERHETLAEKKTLLVPLDSGFLNDQELVYFIRQVFGKHETTTSDQFVNDIITGLRGLRYVGLP